MLSVIEFLNDDFNLMLNKIDNLFIEKSKFYDVDDISIYNNVIEFSLIVELEDDTLTEINVKYDFDDFTLILYTLSKLSKYHCYCYKCDIAIDDFIINNL